MEQYEELDFEDIDEFLSESFTHTSDDLKKLQELDLDRKIKLTQTRLLDWYKYWNGQCYISFSGGKDSTVLAYIAAFVCNTTGDELTLWFCNTGMEFPEVINHVKSYQCFLRSQFPEVNINLIIDYPRRGKIDKKTGKQKGTRILFKDVISEYGYPLISKEVSQKIYETRRNPNCASAKAFDKDSQYAKKYGGKFNMSRWNWLKDSNIPVSHMCCKLMKERPALHYETKSGKKPVTGMMANESRQRRQQWLNYGCNAFNVDRPRSNPMAFWTEQDILEFIYRYDVPIATIYGEVRNNKDGRYCNTGKDRTGCMFCGFGAHLESEPNRYQQLKQTHPKIWEYCMKPIDEGGLGMREPLEFIGVKVE